MTYLCWLLMWFEAISDLKINLDKSELYLVGVGEDPKDLAINNGIRLVAFIPPIWVYLWEFGNGLG